MLKIIDVWVAHGDGGERGIGPVIAICDTEENAKIAAEGKAFYGANGHVNKRKAVQDPATQEVYLLDLSFQHQVKMNENVQERKKEIKEKALKKLNAVEIAVLGIK